MLSRLDRAHRTLPVILGLLTLAGVGVLLAWDGFPQLFPPRTHDFAAAFPLATIAIAYMVYQLAHRPSREETIKTIVLALAFLFWAANQLWPNLPQATLFNDIAIALFVLDVFCVIVGWPASSQDGSFGETCLNCRDCQVCGAAKRP